MSGIFTDAQIAGFRALVQDLAMPDTFAVLRMVGGVDNGYGGRTGGTETQTSSGICLVKEQPTGAEQQIAASLQVVRPVLVELPTGTDTREGDTLLINGSRRMAVVVVDRGSTYAVTLSAVCSEVT